LLLEERIEAHGRRELLHLVHETGIERVLLVLMLLGKLGHELGWVIVQPLGLV